MKKIFIIIAMLSAVSTVYAQKKKPAAPAAAKVDAAKADADAKARAAQDAANAKAADLQNKANDKIAAATAVDESKFTVGVWGGYDIAGKSDYVKNRESLFSSSGAVAAGVTSPSSSTKMGGIAGGIDFWYGSKLQFGLGVGYLKGHNIEATAKDGVGDGLKITATMDYLPTVLQARYYVIEGLYFGAGLGVAFLSNGTDVVKETSGTLNTLSDLTYKGRVIVLQGRLGYDYPLTNALNIGVAGIFTYTTGEAETAIYNAAGSALEKKTLKLDSFHITPSIYVSYKF